MDVLLGAGDKLAYSGIGGSTGNVLSILAFLGWHSMPLVNLGRDRVGAAIHREFARLGADVSHVRLDRGLTSPLLYQFAGDPTHAPRYSFACPVCGRSRKFSESLVDSGGDDFDRCAATSNVFFFDRVTPGTVRMAAAARAGGSLVFFEPSAITPNRDLFFAALKSSHVVKYSADRIGEPFTDLLHWGFIEIQTQGSRGLRFRKHSLAPDWVELPALRTSWVADTSGAGDWCTSGFLHSLLSAREGGNDLHDLTYNEIYRALRLGQSVAALSVGHIGARGLMRAWRSDETLAKARTVMDDGYSSEGMAPLRPTPAFDTVCCEAVTSYLRPQPMRLPLSF
jgi:fructokinase